MNYEKNTHYLDLNFKKSSLPFSKLTSHYDNEIQDLSTYILKVGTYLQTKKRNTIWLEDILYSFDNKYINNTISRIIKNILKDY